MSNISRMTIDVPEEFKNEVKSHASLLGKNFKVEEGVQCESCHGAGEKYKKKSIMKDHAKSVAAGLTEFKDKAPIEKLCVTCHNKKSPTFKDFDFEKRWAEIAHNIPKK